MLKIKDDIDLNELKKVGFKKSDSYLFRKIDNDWWNLIQIDLIDREIYQATEVIGYWEIISSDDIGFDKKYIKDLIKEGWVIEINDE